MISKTIGFRGTLFSDTPISKQANAWWLEGHGDKNAIPMSLDGLKNQGLVLLGPDTMGKPRQPPFWNSKNVGNVQIDGGYIITNNFFHILETLLSASFWGLWYSRILKKRLKVATLVKPPLRFCFPSFWKGPSCLGVCLGDTYGDPQIGGKWKSIISPFASLPKLRAYNLIGGPFPHVQTNSSTQ